MEAPPSWLSEVEMTRGQITDLTGIAENTLADWVEKRGLAARKAGDVTFLVPRTVVEFVVNHPELPAARRALERARQSPPPGPDDARLDVDLAAARATADALFDALVAALKDSVARAQAHLEQVEALQRAFNARDAARIAGLPTDLETLVRELHAEPMSLEGPGSSASTQA